jgi:hypothetical protein
MNLSSIRDSCLKFDVGLLDVVMPKFKLALDACFPLQLFACTRGFGSSRIESDGHPFTRRPPPSALFSLVR